MKYFSFLLLASQAFACTTFSLWTGNQPVIGKNYDWSVGGGFVFTNKAGVAKKALLLSADEPVQWMSRYPSVTFNQYGREFPLGGMNSQGLVVEIMWLERSTFPETDERKAINQLQWIQNQLDL